MSLDFIYFVFVVVVRVEPWQGKIATSSYISCFCVDLNQVSELQSVIWSRPFHTIFCGESEDACPSERPKGPKEVRKIRKLEGAEKP